MPFWYLILAFILGWIVAFIPPVVREVRYARHRGERVILRPVLFWITLVLVHAASAIGVWFGRDVDKVWDIACGFHAKHRLSEWPHQEEDLYRFNMHPYF